MEWIKVTFIIVEELNKYMKDDKLQLCEALDIVHQTLQNMGIDPVIYERKK